MKLFTILAILLTSIQTLAIEVSGTISYKLPSGEIADRHVTIDVPARGDGSIILSGDKFSWSSDNFWIEKFESNTFFTTVFKTEFRTFKSTLALRGVYVRTDEIVSYKGIVFKKEGHHDINDKDISDFGFVGTFEFSTYR